MNKIVSKSQFSEKVYKFEIEAPLIAKARKAGHFVIVRVGEKGERMPLTIAGADPIKGTITLVVQKVGLSSTKLCNLNEGDYITDVVGPLGKATHIDKFGTVICAGGGVGVGVELAVQCASRTMFDTTGREKSYFTLLPLRYHPSNVYPERVGAFGSDTGKPVKTVTLASPDSMPPFASNVINT